METAISNEVSLGIGNPADVLDVNRPKKRLLSKACHIPVNRLAESDGEKIYADAVVGEMRSRRIAHRPLEHPTPQRADLYVRSVVMRHVEAGRHREEIAHRHIP